MAENFLKKLLFAYAPLFGKDKAEQFELRRIIKRLKKNDKELMDPVQLKMKPLFCGLILEAVEISERLKQLFIGNMESPEDEYNEFELKLCSILLEKGNLTLDQLTLEHIVKTAHGEGQGGINTVDRIFRSRIKYFSQKNFKVVRHLLERNKVYTAFSFFDYERITRNIVGSKEGKNGVIAGELIFEPLKNLLYLVKALPDKKRAVLDDPVILTAYRQNEVNLDFSLEKIQTDIHRLHEIFNGPLSSSFLSNAICVIGRITDPQVEVYESESTFPKEIYDGLVEKFRIDREKFISIENEKVLKSRINSLFKDRHLAGLHVYNNDSSNLFTEAKLPSLKYIIPMRIVKSFNTFFYKSIILSVLQEYQVESEYFNDKQKEEFQSIVEAYEMIVEKSGKFEEDLNIPSFSELLPFIEVMRNSILDNKAKNKAREAIKRVNDRADRIIQETFTAAINLHGYLTSIVVDMKSAVPKLLSNTLYLNNNKNELCSGLDESTEQFNKFIKLLKIFAVNMDVLRKSVKESSKEWETEVIE